MRRFFLIVVCLLCYAAPVYTSAQSQATDWTLSDYEQVMREILAASQRNDEIGVREAAERLFQITAIKTPTGEVLPVNNDWLQEELEGNSPSLERIEEQSGVIVETLTNTELHDPADLQVIKDILSDDPYNLVNEQAQPISTGSGPSFDFIGECFTVLGFILVGFLVIYILLMVRRAITQKKSVEEPSSAPPKELAPVKLPVSSAKAIQQADEEAIAGDFREAVRYLYLSTLLWLAERNAIMFDRTLTNREVLAALPADSMLRSRLTPVVQTFDRVWYGFKEIDQQDFELYRKQVTELRGGQ